jgi:hypothetical protein
MTMQALSRKRVSKRVREKSLSPTRWHRSGEAGIAANKRAPPLVKLETDRFHYCRMASSSITRPNSLIPGILDARVNPHPSTVSYLIGAMQVTRGPQNR